MDSEVGQASNAGRFGMPATTAGPARGGPCGGGAGSGGSRDLRRDAGVSARGSRAAARQPWRRRPRGVGGAPASRWRVGAAMGAAAGGNGSRTGARGRGLRARPGAPGAGVGRRGRRGRAPLPLTASVARRAGRGGGGARRPRPRCRAPPTSARRIEEIVAPTSGRSPTTPAGRAHLVLARGEAARFAGIGECAAWGEATAACRATAEPLLLAYALIGEAEALAAAGRRKDAAARLAEGSALARRVEAVPLAQEAAALARRARLPLEGDAPGRAAGEEGSGDDADATRPPDADWGPDRVSARSSCS
ncbi:MAG: hypothetical protein JWO14_1593 [Solirubrobacterales bacterium]|nr:hypothetical protein [Solirubrobacterales bacterium]